MAHRMLKSKINRLLSPRAPHKINLDFYLNWFIVIKILRE